MGTSPTLQLASLRSALAPLSQNIPDYYRQIRAAGFASCLVNEDWIELKCDPASLDIHRTYLGELFREAMVRGSVTDIVYTDRADCHSTWLNEQKARRLAKVGRIEQLGDGPSTRHQKELSPV